MLSKIQKLLDYISSNFEMLLSRRCVYGKTLITTVSQNLANSTRCPRSVCMQSVLTIGNRGERISTGTSFAIEQKCLMHAALTLGSGHGTYSS